MAPVRTAITVVFLLGMALGDPTSINNDEEQIIKQMNAFHKHFHSPNPEALYDQIYLPEAYIMPPNEPSREGKANIIAMLSRFMDHMKEVYFRSERIEIHRNLAIQVFRYEEDGENGKALEIGKAIIIWKKDQVTSQWRILYNIWNES